MVSVCLVDFTQLGNVGSPRLQPGYVHTQVSSSVTGTNSVLVSN